MIIYSWRYYLLLTVLSVFCFFQNTSALQAPYSHVKTADVDNIFSSFGPNTPGCAVGVISDGDLIFAKGYGAANLDHGIPIRPQSRFMVASISKQFSAAALLMLEQEGDLDLDEDLRKYIPGLPVYDHAITARQVMHHTSGLRDMFSLLALGDIGLDNTTTVDQATAMISRQQGLNFRPGSRYLYSNSGYFLISVLVENISGMSLREYTDKHFFKPIGMTSTHFHDDTGMIVPDRVISYRPTNNGPGQFYRTNADKVGARGLFTTIEDMALWDYNFIDNKTNLENFTKRMTELGVTIYGSTFNYASGLRINRYKSLKTVGHDGNYMGFRSSYKRFLKQRLSVVTLCNMSNINPADYARQVADLYLQKVFNDQFNIYAGNYRNGPSGTRQVIVLENGNLYLKEGLNDKKRLTWQGDDQFRTGQWNVRFRRNDQNEINHLLIKTPGTGDITFKKVE
ncbi:MAG: serine hydrolase domain-containing protein [Balneolales bacterium]